MREQTGFSLIELLIVVAIILLIAAIAIPNFVRSRMAADDSAAAGALRVINSGETGYFGAYPQIGYATNLAVLGGASPCTPNPATACLIDNNLATNGGGGIKGFNFNATGSASGSSIINDQFYSTAAPMNQISGTKSYCVIEDGIIRIQPVGILVVVPSYAACQALAAMP